MMMTMNKMNKSIKTMVLTGAAVTVMMSLAAPAAMAQEQQGQVLPDHRDGGNSNGTSITVAEEAPLKDPGIKLNDIVPTDGQEEDTADGDSGTHDSPSPVEGEGDRIKNPGIKLSDIVPPDGQEEEDTTDGDSGTHDPGSSIEGEEEDRIKDPGIRLCDITPTDCQNPDDSRDDQGSNPGARPEAKDPNPVEEESSAPGEVKAGEEVPMGITKSTPQSATSDPKEALSASDEAGQIANSEADSSPTVYGCPFDYEYIEKVDTCFPTPSFFPMINGETPWPDSLGGYVGLPGNLVGDTVSVVGAGLQIGLGHYVGDTLVEFGEGGGPIGWAIQGVGHTLGFAADTTGVILQGAGEVVGAVSDGASVVVDTVVETVVTPVLSGVVEGVEAVVESVEKVADVAKSTWKKISSWF